jgi:hypothetical protein
MLTQGRARMHFTRRTIFQSRFPVPASRCTFGHDPSMDRFSEACRFWARFPLGSLPPVPRPMLGSEQGAPTSRPPHGASSIRKPLASPHQHRLGRATQQPCTSVTLHSRPPARSVFWARSRSKSCRFRATPASRATLRRAARQRARSTQSPALLRFTRAFRQRHAGSRNIHRL